MEVLSYRKVFTVAVDEVDFHSRIKPSAVLQYLQDVATLHASEIGIGYERMQEVNCFWILSRIRYEIIKLPLLGEDVVVTTYPVKPSAVEAIRLFEIHDKNNNLLIRASSRWCIVDVATRAIKRCKPFFPFDDSCFADISIRPCDAIDSCSGDSCSKYEDRVRLTDLDRNFHMNNARFADLAVNALDLEDYRSRDIAEFSINYLGELKFGEQIVVHHCAENNSTTFEGRTSDKVAFRARINWKI